MIATIDGLTWSDEIDVVLDGTVVFGKAYDFFGLRFMAEQASDATGKYLIWPSGGKWSLYRDTDGRLAFESLATREHAVELAERWRTIWEAT